MKIYLVDGTYELFRSFYGPPPKKDPDGREVGATVGLLRSLLSLIKDSGATHIGCAFDHVVESFRNELFEGYIYRSKLTLHFNRHIWLRFVAQYNDFRETWDFDPLLTYQINPFTLFYVGTTYDYREYHDLNSQGNGYVDDPTIDLSYSHTKLKARQFFMKLQYLFQI